MGVIFSDYGIEISEEHGKYFLEYDEGELVSKYRKIEISSKDAEKAKKSPQDAYDVIIAFQNNEIRAKKNKH